MGIQICSHCGGEGKIIETDNYNKFVGINNCTTCSGYGRVYTKEYSITVPFNESRNSNFLDADAKIIEIIRNISL